MNGTTAYTKYRNYVSDKFHDFCNDFKSEDVLKNVAFSDVLDYM